MGCQQITPPLEPKIFYSPQKHVIQNLTSQFSPLSEAERKQDFGKELYIGKSFCKERDYYRAITCFKRALFLLPKKNPNRRQEIEYEIFLSYYIAEKYEEAVESFESSQLCGTDETFPHYRTLQLTLYDAYYKTHQTERWKKIHSEIKQQDPILADKLLLSQSILEANFPELKAIAEDSSYKTILLDKVTQYEREKKSVHQAKLLNALIPGAGYYYVGQKKSAVTSFIINALFITASYQLFNRGYIPAAIITSSLELGWYFGGINGAGIEAMQYNQCLYERMGKEILMQEKLFPLLMIEQEF